MDLFDDPHAEPSPEPIAPGAWLLRGLARAQDAALIAAIEAITAQAPFRQLTTRGGFTMSVAMSNCGACGWVSDRRGYRYESCDPQTGAPWPAMPEVFTSLAARASDAAGFPGFAPDACLINRYVPGARMSPHQDRDEQDFSQPIVSVSLGIPAVFLFGGTTRAEKPQRVPLAHGDVVVWGGPARLHFHGVQPLKPAQHALLGSLRYNLTFRRAR